MATMACLGVGRVGGGEGGGLDRKSTLRSLFFWVGEEASVWAGLNFGLKIQTETEARQREHAANGRGKI